MPSYGNVEFAGMRIPLKKLGNECAARLLKIAIEDIEDDIEWYEDYIQDVVYREHLYGFNVDEYPEDLKEALRRAEELDALLGELYQKKEELRKVLKYFEEL